MTRPGRKVFSVATRAGATQLARAVAPARSSVPGSHVTMASDKENASGSMATDAQAGDGKVSSTVSDVSGRAQRTNASQRSNDERSADR